MRAAEPLLETACRQGEARWLDYALLVDKRLMTSGQPQRYGTQYEQGADGTWVLSAVEEPEGLRARRAALGLEEEE